MKKMLLLCIMLLVNVPLLFSQEAPPGRDQRTAITNLIGRYSEAREKNDTVLLKQILTTDADQLVSTGEWRRGIAEAVQGMQRSSGNNPGTRTLRVENIRMLSATSAIVDCRYIIQSAAGQTRNMWSTFIVVSELDRWKISAIRNMLPAGSGS